MSGMGLGIDASIKAVHSIVTAGRSTIYELSDKQGHLFTEIETYMKGMGRGLHQIERDSFGKAVKVVDEMQGLPVDIYTRFGDGVKLDTNGRQYVHFDMNMDKDLDIGNKLIARSKD